GLGRRAAAIAFRPVGALILAQARAELDLIEAASKRPDADERGFGLVNAVEARRLNPGIGSVLGALHSPLDAIVEPVAALRALRELALDSGRFRSLPGTTGIALDAESVVDHRGRRHQGDAIALCTGDAPELLPPDVWTTHGLARRNLQMLATEATRTQVTTAVGDADAMRYYPAFDLPEREALPEQEPIARLNTAQTSGAPR